MAVRGTEFGLLEKYRTGSGHKKKLPELIDKAEQSLNAKDKHRPLIPQDTDLLQSEELIGEQPTPDTIRYVTEVLDSLSLPRRP